MDEKNVHWQNFSVTKKDRQKLKGHASAVIWLTGLSGSGKSTIANALECELYQRGIHTMILDGDNVRHGLNVDLGFSEVDRRENIRRIGEVAKLFSETGCLVIATFISPYVEDRNMVRKMLDEGEFIEVYVECPLDVCEIRDPKKLYKKARSGQLIGFTGIDAPYEEPVFPEIKINSDRENLRDSVEKILKYLQDRKLI